jgi:4'-phosphopantetheinyl transferase
MTDNGWPVGSLDVPSLGPDEVHVWCAALDQSGSALCTSPDVLAPEEHLRADRFRSPEHSRRYKTARTLLRILLGRYLRRAPEKLRLGYSPSGKPRLADEPEAGGLRFNLSHSRGLALYALARGREVGVDVEHIRPDISVELMVRRFFSPREADFLQSLPQDARLEAFFSYWARKEAYLKAKGLGLAFPLSRFDMSPEPGGSAAPAPGEEDADEAARWRLTMLRPAPGYAAALAVEGHDWQLRCFAWPPPPSG